MSSTAVLLLAFATLTCGCASMSTKRTPGAQIQRTAEPQEPVDTGALEGRPELGQR